MWLGKTEGGGRLRENWRKTQVSRESGRVSEQKDKGKGECQEELTFKGKDTND
jgi:hypothetical protein